VILGEKLSRYAVILMMVFSYLLVFYMIAMKYFTPVMLVVLFAIPVFRDIYPKLLEPRPAEKPADFPEGEGGWPLYFAPYGFINNRRFGGLFVMGLLVDTLLRIFLPEFWI
jgi:hypothetical protein